MSDRRPILDAGPSLNFLAITAALRALPYPRMMLDGEAVAHCPEGLPDFYRLMSDDGQARARRVAMAVAGGLGLRRLPAD